MQARTAKRGRPTQEEIEERKARVLDVAEALFIERGFAGTTVAEIAKLSQVTPRLITAHFGEKAEIFTEIIKGKNDRAAHLVIEIEDEGTLEDVLFGAAQFAWTMAYSPGAISFLRMVVGEGGNLADRTADIAEKSSVHFFGSMEDIFRHLVDRGLIRDENVSRLAKYFVDLVIGFSLVQAGMGYWDRVPDEVELRDKVRFFCRSLLSSDEV